MTDKEVSKKADKTVSQLKMLGIGLQVKRNELGWSIAEVARRSEIHYSYISRVEKGLIWPGAEILQKILTVMGVRLELVGGVSFVKGQDLIVASPGAVSLPGGKGLEQTTSQGVSHGLATPDIVAALNKAERDRAMAGKATTAILSKKNSIGSQKKSNKPAATGFSKPLVRRDKDGKKIIE